jgi:hypothetical protein
MTLIILANDLLCVLAYFMHAWRAGKEEEGLWTWHGFFVKLLLLDYLCNINYKCLLRIYYYLFLSSFQNIYHHLILWVKLNLIPPEDYFHLCFSPEAWKLQFNKLYFISSSLICPWELMTLTGQCYQTITFTDIGAGDWVFSTVTSHSLYYLRLVDIGDNSQLTLIRSKRQEW